MLALPSIMLGDGGRRGVTLLAHRDAVHVCCLELPNKDFLPQRPISPFLICFDSYFTMCTITGQKWLNKMLTLNVGTVLRGFTKRFHSATRAVVRSDFDVKLISPSEGSLFNSSICCCVRFIVPVPVAH